MKTVPRRALCLLAAVLLLSATVSGCGSKPPENSVSGTVRLGANLPVEARHTRTLMIALEPEKGGAAVAMQRVVEPTFPYHFVLTGDDALHTKWPFPGRVRVRVRLDADGRPGPLVRGDYEGRSAQPVAAGAKGVVVVLDQIGTAEPPKVAKRAERLPGAPRTAAPAMPAAPAPAVPPAVGKTITGTVRVAPALASKAGGKAMLFLIARTANPGPPLAVLPIRNPSFPHSFTLSQANVMMQGMPFAGKVKIEAMLDADGQVGSQPGDLEGETKAPVEVGTSGVEIVLDREVGGSGAPASAPAAPAPAKPQAEASAPSGQLPSGHPAPTPPSDMPLPPPSLGGMLTPPAPGATVSGTIEVAPSLALQTAGKTVLYLIARPKGGGTAVAVDRIDNPRFPQPFTLSGQHAMGGGLRGEVEIIARLDADGAAGPPAPGDIEGRTKKPVPAGATGVKIVLDKAY